jgi:hypothetical protein
MRVLILALSKIKNQAVLTPLFFALAVCAGLLSGCENEFVKSAVATLNPEQPPPRVTLEWDADVVYIDPITSKLSGTISGLLNNAGNRVWFSKTENLVLGRDWNVPKPPQELEYEQTGLPGFITAGSIAGFIVGGGPVTTDGDKIDVILDSSSVELTEDNGFDLTLYENGGVSYSFVLYPTAFYGADRNTVMGEKEERLFTLESPTKTFYSKVVMERAEYGSVSVSWADGKGQDENNPWQGMMSLAGGLAAGSASAAAAAWDTDWATDVTVNDVTEEDAEPGQLAAVSWNTLPDTSKSYASYNKYAIALSPYSYSEDVGEPVQPVVSLAIEFTSDVGKTIGGIKAAEKEGGFSSIIYDSSGEDATKTGIESTITGLASNETPVTITWSPAYSDTAPKTPTPYTLTLVIGPGTDGSTGDTITVTAVILPPEDSGS